MSFIISNPKIDFGQTLIENIFINDFMPMADGTHVKVYLMGYKIATDRDSTVEYNNYTLAKLLNLPVEDVLRAWNFWEKKGIIIKHMNSDDKYDYTVEFLSLRQLYIDNNYSAGSAQTVSHETVHKSDPNDLLMANNSPMIQNMFYEVDQIMRRPLNPKEKRYVLDFIYNYNMNPDIIIKAFEYSIETKRVKDLKYIGAILRNWHDKGIINVEKLVEYRGTRDEFQKMYQKVYSLLGYQKSVPTAGDREIMDIWFKEQNLDMDFVEIVLTESSKKTSNVNMNYMDKIIKNLIGEGIDTPEKYKEYLENKATTTQKTVNQKTTATAKKNKFHNFETRKKEYTNEELERILGIRK
ncbi:MAG: DnaD domain protein [Firmicutes bacterium]|jgi:DnaD/phage-associated family protein|nr:DnaD domain protein [Bacillota bacterium]